MKTYIIKGKEITQEKLDFDQILEIYDLAEKHNIELSDLIEMFDDGLTSVVAFLRKQKLIKPLVGIVLKGSEKIDVGKIDGDIILDIVHDFFLCNEKLLTKSAVLTQKLVKSVLVDINKVMKRLRELAVVEKKS